MMTALKLSCMTVLLHKALRAAGRSLMLCVAAAVNERFLAEHTEEKQYNICAACCLADEH